MLTHIRGLILTILLLSGYATNALAWGVEGHQVVARIAQPALSPKASQEINRLLALEPGASLVSISTWADEHRTHQTGSWHYINFSRTGCTYEPARDCPGGACVIEALKVQTQILGSNASDEKKLTALKFVVHLMGDIHQPLHAGFKDDKGGNTYQVQVLGHGTNLHALWDSGLIKTFNESTNALSAQLMAQGSKLLSHQNVSFLSAAQESCSIVQSADFYPPRHVDQKYINRFAPLVKERLLLAGQRLATLLNDTFR